MRSMGKLYPVLASLLVVILTVGLAGCGSDDDGNPNTPPARVPVVEQVTDTSEFEGNPVFSPDGAWILFEAEVDGNYDIYRLAVSGGEPERLTTDPAFDSVPTWSPDGTSIVFESERSGDKDIWSLDLTSPGAEPVQLTFTDSNEGSPTWGPNNMYIAFESNNGKGLGSDIYLVPVGGGDLVRLTETADGIYNRTACWSPDGTQLVFESNVTGYSALHVISASGGETTRITPEASYEGHPAWSPDGTQIAFESTRSGTSEIYTVAPTGGDLFQVTMGGGWWPDWSHDGSEIVYCVFAFGQPNIWTVAVDW